MRTTENETELDSAPSLARLQQENAELREELARVRRTQRELEDARSNYDALFAAVAEGVVVQDAHGTILLCNEAAERTLGLSQEQMAGRSSLDPRWYSVHEDGSTFPGEEHPAMVTLRTGRSVRGEVMGVHKPDGTLTWISINSVPVPLANGTRGVVASFVDTTEYRDALRELEQHGQDLRVALQAGKVGVWRWEMGSGALSWTDQVYELFGIPKGQPVSFEMYLSLLDERDRERVLAAVQHAIDTESTYWIEHRIHLPTGETRWIRGMGEVTRDLRGQVTGMCGAVSDVTEEKRLLERTLQTQRMESIGRLAGGVAHDFNNILTAMIGAIDTGRAETSDPKVRGILDTVDSAATHASQLTRQLLAFARKQVLTLEVCDLDGLLRETEELLRHLLSEDVELSVKSGAGSWRVRLDSTQIQQVVVNLAANARDAMPRGGRLDVSVTRLSQGDSRIPEECREGDWLRLRVSDTGEGIPPEVLDRIFEPFFSTKEHGNGLGLATCYGLVEQCGGRIKCSSQLGVGTIFSIYLPRHEGELNQEQNVQPTEVEAQSATILVVEDQQPVLKVVERALSRAGMRVLTASTPNEGLSVLAENGGEVDLLLTDVVMPQMNGPELAGRARQSAPNLKVMFMSGYSGDAVSGEFDDLGGATIIEKPFRPAELVDKVRRALGAE